MIGAIAGDIIGSVHEGAGTKTKDFPLFVEDSRFTDDTVLTIAVADRLLHGGNYVDLFHEYFHAYPRAGYGASFIRWAGYRRREPYNSWGNGSAMRVSPVGLAVESQFQYDLSSRLDDIWEEYTFDVSCQGSVPQSIIAFLESTDYEDAVRNAISLGGDADTMACIAGGIAEAFYGGVSTEIQEMGLVLLDERLRDTIAEFYDRFGRRVG